MALNAGLARAHRLITLTAGQDSSTSLVWPNGFQPGWEAKGWKSWSFMVGYTGTIPGGLSILFYGTTDPQTARGTAVAPRWFILAAASEQGGTGSVVNPITLADGTQSMQYSQNLEAFRIVANAYTGGGTLLIDVDMAP